jgi:hypothetical protein
MSDGLTSGELHSRAAGAPIAELDWVETATLKASPRVLSIFKNLHGTSLDESLAGVQETTSLLIESGVMRRATTGNWVLYGDGYRIVLDEDAQSIVRYDTVHRQRTLAQFRSGVQSSYRRKPVGPRGLVTRLNDDTIDLVAVPMKVLIDYQETKSRHLDFDSVRIRVADAISTATDLLEDELDSRAAAGLPNLRFDPVVIGDFYELLDSGKHLLIADGLVVTLREDGMRVTQLEDEDS